VRAVVIESFGVPPTVRDVNTPPCPDHGAVVRVHATGVCRSDWHAWLGHDDSVALPHVPGHEFCGEVVGVGSGVRGWSGGERVTAPFVNACGSCTACLEGRQTVCQRQTQPGFDRWGSWAEHVVVHHADVNLVALPDRIDDATAVGLGCRFATAFRAVVTQGRVAPGEHVLVLGCGGVGLAATAIAASRGARVIAVDVSAGAREAAREAGAETVLGAVDGLPERVRELTGDGAHVCIEALGRAELLDQGLASLRPGGRHVQVGLLLGEHAMPAVDVGAVVAHELELLGSHGMGAAEYPAMLAEIADGRLDPSRLVGRRISLSDAPAALVAMSSPATGAGTTVVVL
jgi:D-arabinose 1-dehydrogenase-like Zn-dependent alcohol dehydrogenase